MECAATDLRVRSVRSATVHLQDALRRIVDSLEQRFSNTAFEEHHWNALRSADWSACSRSARSWSARILRAGRRHPACVVRLLFCRPRSFKQQQTKLEAI